MADEEKPAAAAESEQPSPSEDETKIAQPDPQQPEQADQQQDNQEDFPDVTASEDSNKNDDNNDNENNENNNNGGDGDGGDDGGEEKESDEPAKDWPFTTCGMYESTEHGSASQPWTYRGPYAEGVQGGWIVEPQPPTLEELAELAADAVKKSDIPALEEILEEHSEEPVLLAIEQHHLLHLAVLRGELELLDVLLRVNPSLTARDRNKRTILHCALDGPAEKRKQSTMKVIGLLRGEDGSGEAELTEIINSQDGRSRSCVELAARDAGPGMLLHKLLYLKGDISISEDDVRLKGIPKQTPLAMASMAGIPDNVRALCAAKADPNQECKDEANITCTPLIYACMEGHLKVTKILLAAGADYTAKDMANSNTPRQWATLMGNKECQRLLTRVENEAEREQEIKENGGIDNLVDHSVPLSEQAAKLNAQLDSPAGLEIRKRALKAQNAAFCSAASTQFKPLMECFLRNVLKDQPDNVLDYAATFFTRADLADAVLNSKPYKP